MDMGFEVSFAQATLGVVHSFSLLPAGQNVEHLAPSPAPCLSLNCHALQHDANGLNL